MCVRKRWGGSRLGGKTQSIKDRLERAWRGCGVFLVVKSYVGTSRRRSLQLQLRVTLILKAGPQKSLGRDTLSVRDNAREREKNKNELERLMSFLPIVGLGTRMYSKERRLERQKMR